MKSKPLNKRQEEQVVIEILDTLLDNSVPYSGAHRKAQWEKGWGENLKTGDITPKYFGKYKVFRLNGKFVYGLSKDYEQQMLYTIVDKLALKYLRGLDCIAEYGCGTGHNLLRVKGLLSKPVTYLGFDWTKSSNKLVSSLGSDFRGINFDYFNPVDFYDPDGFNLEGSIWGAYTVASLEQTGKDYRKFVAYLLRNKPQVVVHIEPIPELLDPKKLLDYLSIKYMEKRKYLSGYLTYLQSLEKRGKLKILEARRSGIGSQFIDGYSIIVWRPC